MSKGVPSSMERAEEPAAGEWAALRAATLCGAFQISAARVPDRVALVDHADQGRALTWSAYAAAVQRIAGALATLGVRRGERVAFFSRNRPELAIAEAATLHLGAAGVVLYAASPPATIEHVLRDSEPLLLLVESELHSRLEKVRHAVGQTLTLDGGDNGRGALATIAAPAGFDFEAAWRAVAPDDLVGLLYTSGTTGPAKGVEQTHRGALGALGSFDTALGGDGAIHDISYGSMANVGERGIGHWYSFTRGSTRTICRDPSQLGAALGEARPTRLFGPPLVWQALQRALEGSLAVGERVALERAVQRVRAVAHGQASAPPGEPEQALLAKLRERIGLDRMSKALSGAASCPMTVHEHYRALGIDFQEFYAATEFGMACAQRPGTIDLGTLGGPAPDYELRLAADGEVLVRSPHAPRGYRNLPRESRETYGADGWINTGDLGELDHEGRLRLIGRKKETLIPAHGHNVHPASIEAALKDACPTIAQVCVIGDGRSHLAALLVLEPPHAATEPSSCATVAAAIETLNAALPPLERIEAHAILAQPWLPGTELTETFKLRRAQIETKYATEIEALYA
ncbi:MAG TPA: AMP-binding protein [Solirubrobacteraceae bacterium]|nr:AMP-binding protein [Solirubrobacteraceae bacterium]